MPVTEQVKQRPVDPVGAVLQKDKPEVSETAPGLQLMDPKHLGRVYIKDRNGNENVLEGAHFSNLDCKWYKDDGGIHPMFDAYRGRKMSVRFKITNKDKFGNNVDCCVSVLSPLGVAETGNPDWQGIAEGERVETEFGIKFGTFKGYDDPYLKRLRRAAASAFVGFMSPNKKISELTPFLVFASYLYVMDDVIDTYEVDDKGMSHLEVTAMFAAVEDVLLRQRDPENISNELNIPQLKPACRYTEYLRQHLVDNCRPGTVKIWNDDLVKTFSAVALAGSKDWETFKAGPSRESARRMHSSLRLWDSAAIPTIGIQQMIYGHQLDPVVEKSYLHRRVIECVAMQIALVNDIVSYRKEVKEKHTFNVCHAKHTVGNMSLEDAFHETAREADQIVMDLIETEKLMLKLYGEQSPFLKEAIFLYKSNIMGHFQWFNYAMRYHNGVILDIVVHPDSF